MVRPVNRAVILPVFQIPGSVKDDAASPGRRSFFFSAGNQDPITLVILIVKYIRISPVYQLIALIRHDNRVFRILFKMDSVLADCMADVCW